jgi:transcriptional regulator PpsR
LAQAFVSLASDIALVIDAQGIITTVAQDPLTPMAPAAESWIGRRWAETVSGDTRRKIEMLLSDVQSTGLGRRREVNHGEQGNSIPVAYTAVRLGENGPVLAVGRDLRTVAAIQQRFLDTQQEIERSYWRARQNESRHRLLFQVATDAVLVIDAQTLLILQANPATAVLMRAEPWPLAGRVAEQQFEANSRPAVTELLHRARTAGRPAEIHARLAGSHLSVGVLVTPLHGNDGLQLMLRVRAAEPLPSDTASLETTLTRLVDGMRDGIVVTDSGGQVVVANRAFVNLVQADSEEQVRGRPFAQWLGRLETDVPALAASVRARGLVLAVPLGLRRPESGPLDVEVFGSLLIEGDQECFGYIVRPRTSRRSDLPVGTAAELARAIETLSATLGSAPLPELMRRAERLVRRHLLQKALVGTATDDGAARLLGVTDQQLAHLRREFGLESTVPPR